MKPFTALLGAAAGTHAADQLALATLPLTATLVLGAGPDLLGLLVALQSATWLLVSPPAGAWVDRLPRRTLLLVGLALGLAASIVATVAAIAGTTALLGIAAFVGASGTVIYVLTSVSLLPSVEAQGFLGRPPEGSSRLVRYVFNLVDLRRKLTREVVTLLRQRLGQSMIGIVNYDDSFGEAVAHQQLVIDRAPVSKASADVRGLAAAVRALLPVAPVTGGR